MRNTHDARNELSILQRLQDHPNIVKLLHFSETETEIKMYFPSIPQTILDRVQDSKRGLPMRTVHSIFMQILSGLSYIHSNNFVHQDLKLENILIDENDHIYIIDFGFSRPYVPGVRNFLHNCGSTHYAAPEIWLQRKCEGPEVDMWSLGVSLFLMLTAYFPFGGETPRDVWSSVRRGLQWLPKHVRNDPPLHALVQSLLTFSSSRRITLPDVLRNQWVLDGTFVCTSASHPLPISAPLVQLQDSLTATPAPFLVSRSSSQISGLPEPEHATDVTMSPMTAAEYQQNLLTKNRPFQKLTRNVRRLFTSSFGIKN